MKLRTHPARTLALLLRAPGSRLPAPSSQRPFLFRRGESPCRQPTYLTKVIPGAPAKTPRQSRPVSAACHSPKGPSRNPCGSSHLPQSRPRGEGGRVHSTFVPSVGGPFKPGFGLSGAVPQCPCSSRYFSASRAAMHPVPAAVIACRYRRSCTSPHAYTPGIRVNTLLWVLM